MDLSRLIQRLKNHHSTEIVFEPQALFDMCHCRAPVYTLSELPSPCRGDFLGQGFSMRVTLGVILIRSLVFTKHIPGRLRSGSGVALK